MAKRTSPKLEITEIAKLLGLPGPEAWTEWFNESGDPTYGQAYDAAYDEAVEDGMSEDAADTVAEEAAYKAEQIVGDEHYLACEAALLHVAEKLFEQHGLELQQDAKKSYLYEVVPIKSWEAAARKILETIHGVGMFEFSSLKEFISSGPYRGARGAVLNHLHWIKDAPAVYGERSPRDMFDRYLRY